MRGDRGNSKCFGGGSDHRATAAQGISGRAGGGGDDKPIGPIGGEILPIQPSLDGNHGGSVLPVHRNFVEGKSLFSKVVAFRFGFNAQERPLRNVVFLMKQFIDGFFYLLLVYRRQKT